MPDREKLIEIIGSTTYGNGSKIGDNFQRGFIERIADNLLANGATVLTPDEAKNIYTVQEIEEIQGEAYDLGAESVLHNHFGLSWNDAEEVRKEVAKLQTAFRWIPVTERLPERTDGHVLVTDGDKVKISCRNAMYKTRGGETWCAQNYGAGMCVTHWMPLPEPPKGD